MPAEYGAGALMWVNDAIDTMSRGLHPLLATIRRERVLDLPRPEEHAAGSEHLASPLYRGIEIQHVVTSNVRDTVEGDIEAFLTLVFELADEFGSQMMRGMLDHVSDICDASGQTINAQGRDYFDVMLETLETIDMSFDEDGKPNLTLVAHPETARKIQAKQPTPEQQERLRQLLERRREEWSASRHRRDLP
jgi:hypothetical protein